MFVKRIYYKKFFFIFQIVNYLLLFSFLPFIIFQIIIYPIFKIRLGFVDTKTIGNSVSAFEIFNNENKDKKKRGGGGILWFHEKKISNSFWLNRIKKLFFLFQVF
jgi:hypothetical protein